MTAQVVNFDRRKQLKSLEYNGNSPSVGEKWNRDVSKLRTTDIAKLIRKDVAEVFKKADGWKISITSEYFAGGSSINLTVKKSPIVLREYNEELGYETLNEEGKKVQKELEQLVDAYNFDGSDTQTDYFYKNYYSHVRI
jgi:hypothetical protein